MRAVLEPWVTRLRALRGVGQWVHWRSQLSDGCEVRYVGRACFGDSVRAAFGIGEVQEQPERPGGLGLLGRRASLAAAAGAHALIVDPLLRGVDASARPESVFGFSPFFGAQLPVRPNHEEQLSSVRSNGYRRFLKRTHKDLRFHVATADADVRHFYDEMYVPFARQRHREDAKVEPFEAVSALMARANGRLVMCDTEPVAALVYAPRSTPGVLVWWKVGNAKSEGLSPADLRYRSALAELAVLEHARQGGFTALDLGLARAVPGDGVLVHKHRLGCVFAPPRAQPVFGLILAADRRRELLSAHPLFVQGSRGVRALIGCTEASTPERFGAVVDGAGIFGLEGITLYCAAAVAAQHESALAEARAHYPIEVIE